MGGNPADHPPPNTKDIFFPLPPGWLRGKGTVPVLGAHEYLCQPMARVRLSTGNAVFINAEEKDELLGKAIKAFGTSHSDPGMVL